MNFVFRCEIRCSVIKVVIVKKGYGSVNFFVIVSKLIIEVLFGDMVFINCSICFFIKVIVLSIYGGYFELSNCFVILMVDVDEVVVCGVGMNELF